MTAACRGGASTTKPGVVQNNIIAGALITEGLTFITPWLIPFAAYIDAFLYNATAQCISDPPIMPTNADLSPLNAIGGVFNPNFQTWLTAVQNLLLNYFWTVFCECVATVAIPPTYPTLPATVSVPGPQNGLTYQQEKVAHNALAAWALSEPSGLDFAPYISGQHMTLSGVADYQQAGPFATSFGLNLHVGAKIGFTYSRSIAPPFSTECWFKLPSVTPAANQILFYAGLNTANGAGVYVSTTGNIHLLHGGVADIDTGSAWPDTNWHHFILTSNANFTVGTMFLDGVALWRGSFANPIAPVPNTQFFGGDSGNPSANQILMAMPAVYPIELLSNDVAVEYASAIGPPPPLSTAGTSSASFDTEAISLLRAIYNGVVPALTSYAESTVHSSLIGNGSIVFTNAAIAIKVIITTDIPSLGFSDGNPQFLFARGFIVPLTAEAPVRQQVRLCYNPQLFQLPATCDGIGYSLPRGLVISITELVKGP